MCEFVNFTHSKIWVSQNFFVPLRENSRRRENIMKEEKRLRVGELTLDEMYDIFMSDDYKEFRDEYQLELKTLPDGTRRLAKPLMGYYSDTLPLIYRHIEAEEALASDYKKVNWEDYCAFDLYGFYGLYELWMKPLVWSNPLELKDRVVDGYVAKEIYDGYRIFDIEPILNYIEAERLRRFANNPPLADRDYMKSGCQIAGIHFWTDITKETHSLDQKIVKEEHVTLDDIRATRNFDATSLRENLTYIAALCGEKRAAELLRMLQKEWSTIKIWKCDLDNMTDAEILEFETTLFNGFNDLLAKWEGAEEEVVEGNRFSLLTDACIAEGKEAKVISELRAACKGTAPALWKVIRTNEALGYLGTRDLEASVIYRAFTEYFGKLPYTERNFRDARGKV